MLSAAESLAHSKHVTADIDMSLKDYFICVNIFKMETTANILKNSTNKTG